MSEPVATPTTRRDGRWTALGFTALMLTTLVPTGFFYASLLVPRLVQCTPYVGVSVVVFGLGLLLLGGGIVLAAVVLFARQGNPARALAIVALGVAVGPAIIGATAALFLFFPLAPTSCE